MEGTILHTKNKLSYKNNKCFTVHQYPLFTPLFSVCKINAKLTCPDKVRHDDVQLLGNMVQY